MSCLPVHHLSFSKHVHVDPSGMSYYDGRKSHSLALHNHTNARYNIVTPSQQSASMQRQQQRARPQPSQLHRQPLTARGENPLDLPTKFREQIFRSPIWMAAQATATPLIHHSHARSSGAHALHMINHTSVLTVRGNIGIQLRREAARHRAHLMNIKAVATDSSCLQPAGN